MTGPEAPSRDPALAAARALAPQARARAAEIERARRLPPDLVGALADAGLFRLGVPRALGGAEVAPAVLLGVIEELAAADGSTGWCVMVGATSGLIAAYLPEAAGREIYGQPGVVTGGVFAPDGRAVPVEGGYRVNGRWAFASGCQHCQWLMGGCMLIEDGRARLLPSGQPDSRMVLFPAADARILDTWWVSGLSGTGSHDIEARDLFVPEGRALSLVTDPPRHPGPLYAFPVFGMLALGIAAVALGIARQAVDALVDLARTKTPTLSQRRLAARPAVQAAVAEAEGWRRSARALLFEAVEEAWQDAGRGAGVPVERRAALRLAATHAVRGAARAVDVMYEVGGGSAIYAGSPLQRCFRDVHVATQHMMVAGPSLELAGRVLLGVDTDVSML